MSGPVTEADKGTKDQPGSYCPRDFVLHADRKIVHLCFLVCKVENKMASPSLVNWKREWIQNAKHGAFLIERGQQMFSSVQSLSRVQLFATPWIAARQASLSITNSRSSHKLMSIESVMPSSHLILWRPLLLLPPILPSIRVFSNESTLRMRWPKYWSFSFSIIPSKEHPGLMFFRMDWLDLLVVQGTLKSLLQQHSLKALSLQCSAFFTVQLLYPYMTTGKTIALTRRTFVGKVMSLDGHHQKVYK